MLERLLDDLRMDPALIASAEYWLRQRASSIAGELASASNADASTTLARNIVYLGTGFKDGRLDMLYVGKTARGYSRIAEHIRATVAWKIAGAEAAPLHYQTAAGCDRVIYFNLVEATSGNSAEAAITLAIWEWLLCWLLGTFPAEC